jgi:hypothetical protein
MKRIAEHLAAIKILREADVKGSGTIGAYHAWRVAPLMARTLLMHRIVTTQESTHQKYQLHKIFLKSPCSDECHM